MKTMSLILTSLTLTTSAAFADVAWVQTNFWQSPYFKNAKVQVLKPSDELVKHCQWYQGLVFDKAGKARVWRAEQVDQSRTMPLESSMESSFSTEILTSLPLNGSVLSSEDVNNLSTVLNSVTSPSRRPGFNQKTKEMKLNYSTISDFEVSYSDKSLTKVSADFGSKPLSIKLVERNKGVYLNVLSADTACDLLSGQLKLKAHVKAGVKISFDEQMKLINFYTSVESAYSDSLKRYRSSRARAASLGVKLGNILSKSELSSNALMEDHLGNLMEDLFSDDKLALSPIWRQDGERKYFSIDGTSDPVSVQLEFN